MDKMPSDGAVKGLLDRLYDAFDEATINDVDVASEALADEGINPDALARRVLETVRRAERQNILIRSREQLARVRERLHEAPRRAATTIEAVHARIVATLGVSGEPSLQAYFRKLETMDNEDLTALEDDAALLDWLNQHRGEVV